VNGTTFRKKSKHRQIKSLNKYQHKILVGIFCNTFDLVQMEITYSNPIRQLERKLRHATITQYRYFVARQKLKSAQKKY